MILSVSNTLLEDLAAAKESGYIEDFMYLDNQLIARNSKKAYAAKDCTLMEYCRHEGMNDPSDASIVFLIKCTDGTKGCLSSAYGKDADTDLIDFVLALEKV